MWGCEVRRRYIDVLLTVLPVLWGCSAEVEEPGVRVLECCRLAEDCDEFPGYDFCSDGGVCSECQSDTNCAIDYFCVMDGYGFASCERKG